MIEVKNLSYVYSPKTPFTKQALFGVDLDIEDGDFFGIIGSTGAGKSTLVSHFNALTRVQKNSGTVIVDGMDLSKKKLDLKKVRATVGMVFQKSRAFDDRTESKGEGSYRAGRARLRRNSRAFAVRAVGRAKTQSGACRRSCDVAKDTRSRRADGGARSQSQARDHGPYSQGQARVQDNRHDLAQHGRDRGVLQ